MKKLIYILFLLVFSANCLNAQSLKKISQEIVWQAFGGLNLGATSPVPTPDGVKEIYAWYPNTNPSIGITGIYHFDKARKHGLGISIQAERKSFRATTRLENLKAGANSGPNDLPISGNQRTSFEARYIGLPIFYNVSLAKHRVNLYVGSYASLLLGAEFKIVLDSEPESLDDSGFQRVNLTDYVRPMEIGLLFGSDFFFTDDLAATLRFNAGLTSATKEDFSKVGFPLHNLYAFVGVTYRFK